ncbi:phage tail spike protein [Peribacillus simplex]|uniref:phage tail spike protein n=1 Tax=Peribacillus simplex TaxID=1478 RepID=UPI0033968756
MLKGIDVSHWQGSIDWDKVANDGVQFAILKATDSTTYIDPTFKTNVTNAKNNGIKVGAYHFARFKSNTEALKEAQLFYNTVKGYNLDLPLVLDIEVDAGKIGKTALTEAARTFLDYLKSQGQKVMIYTYYSFYMDNIDATGYPLWIARYTTAEAPGVEGWTVWQYTDKGTVSGIDGNVDVNRAIDSFFDGLTTNPDPGDPIVEVPDLEEPGDMTYEVVKDVFLHQMKVENKQTGEQIEIVGVEPAITDSLNGKKDLSFTISLTEDNRVEYDQLINDNIIVIDEKRFKKQRYFILNVESDHIEFVKTITASHTYVTRLVNNYVSRAKKGKLSLKTGLDVALSGSGFSYILAADAKELADVEYENFGEDNSMALMDQLIEDFNLEIDVDNTKIYVYKNMGKKINYKLDTRYNVAGLKTSTSTQNSTTRIMGYGKKDAKDKYLFDPVLYVHPEEKKYLLDGAPRWADELRDERYTSKSSILRPMKRLVNPYPEITANVDFAVFYDPVIEDIEKAFYKGDTIGVIGDTAAGGTFEDELRIIDIKYNPLDKYSKPEVNFSNFRKDIYDLQVDNKVNIKKQAKKIRSVADLISEIMP